MAARLTEKQKNKIVADYLENGSYNATAKMNGVCDTTVKRVVQSCRDFRKKAEEKREKDEADIIAYMESKASTVCEIVGLGLEALKDPEKFASATPPQITTAIGTLLDKWGAITTGVNGAQEDDALSKSLKELAANLESDEND